MASRACLVLLLLIPFLTNVNAIPLRVLQVSSSLTTYPASQCHPTPPPTVYGVGQIATLPSGTPVTTFPGADPNCCNWQIIEKTDSDCNNILAPTTSGYAVGLSQLVSLNTGLRDDCSNIQAHGYAPSQGVA